MQAKLFPGKDGTLIAFSSANALSVVTFLVAMMIYFASRAPTTQFTNRWL